MGCAQIDGDGDSDRREGSFCHGSESEEEGEGAEEILMILPRVMPRTIGRGVTRNIPTPLR